MSARDCSCRHTRADHTPKCRRCKCVEFREKPRRARGDGGLFQRKNGLWEGRVQLPPGPDGKRRYRAVSSKDFATAGAELRKLRQAVDEGRIAVTGSTSVGQWLDRWLNDIHSKRKIRPGTIEDYRACIDNHIKPAIGAKRVEKLTPQHVRDMHTAIGARRTAVVAHVILQKALKDAIREGVVTRNVAELVDKPVYTKRKRTSMAEDVAKRVISAALASCDEMTASRIIAGFLTGARRGELLGLRWSYVDLERNVLDFSWQLQQLGQTHGCGEPLDAPSPLCRRDRMPKKPPYWPCGKTLAAYCPDRHWDLKPGFEYEVCDRSLLFTRPKTEAGRRVVPAVAPLVAALTRLRRFPSPHNLVWHHGGKPIDPRADYEMWRTVFRTAGVIGPTESLPPHVARHTAATLLRSAGVDEQTRMEILGHATVDSQRVYAGADAARHTEAMNKLAILAPKELTG